MNANTQALFNNEAVAPRSEGESSEKIADQLLASLSMVRRAEKPGASAPEKAAGTRQ